MNTLRWSTFLPILFYIIYRMLYQNSLYQYLKKPKL